ncbi:MAG TPA: ATP synthase F0 subunit B [Thermoanaerobaculia bacterium]|nr:ATP synthase F0 subunit B [Thermoanaerobaculia bacterium]
MEIDASVAVIAVIFGVTFLVLRNFLFKPVLGLLQERAEEARSAREVWEETRALGEAELEAQRARLSETRVAARARRDEVRREAQRARQELLASAKRDAEQRLAQAQAELERTLAEQRQALEAQARNLAGQMADRLLGRAS